MKDLVTAGSTRVPIDQVRVISNIFGGKTGTDIAEYFFNQGDEVTLITSNPALIKINSHRLKIIVFRTYDELMQTMEEQITGGHFDVIIHSAAVSDYKVVGAFVKNEAGELVSADRQDAKISSAHSSLFLEMVPTLKIVDLIRNPWGFTGKLVKFKLEVGLTDKELIEVAKKSRATSDADFIVANCLEWSRNCAYIINRVGTRLRTSRKNLAIKLRRALT